MKWRRYLPLLAVFALACRGSSAVGAPEPSVYSEPGATEESHQRATLRVEGMICESCAQAVQGNLEELRGVVSAQTSFPSDDVVVMFDPEQTNVQAMAARLEAIERDPAPSFSVTESASGSERSAE